LCLKEQDPCPGLCSAASTRLSSRHDPGAPAPYRAQGWGLTGFEVCMARLSEEGVGSPGTQRSSVALGLTLCCVHTPLLLIPQAPERVLCAWQLLKTSGLCARCPEVLTHFACHWLFLPSCSQRAAETGSMANFYFFIQFFFFGDLRFLSGFVFHSCYFECILY
jgi:hypothetical protein